MVEFEIETIDIGLFKRQEVTYLRTRYIAKWRNGEMRTMARTTL